MVSSVECPSWLSLSIISANSRIIAFNKVILNVGNNILKIKKYPSTQ
ncbi:hypothetical protein PROVRUST_06275 [Providencia rustigianii DSM 4541]|uniref:Uncharacterized protein n=1 Tax=Providencia rustigianii DSM 4541 TaxID=500637 RepID=D1P251_9GAMM|nr:hypothetical protein PROVRUST_06275 [Providencia rustigianii DSM 4541]